MTAKQLRGPAYTLARFSERYGMSEDQAEPLFLKFGPSAIDLDILMRAKGKVPVSEQVN